MPLGKYTALVPYTRSFNARNQLTSVNLPGQVDVYRYDGHGRRTSIQRNGQTTTQLYSREGQLLYERSPNGLVTRHIHLGGRLVASVVGGVTTYQHTDHLGSPIRRTNTAGTLTGMTIYAPYGSVVAGTVGQGPGFTGHVNDTGSGLVYMQQRHYDPIAMRFVSADPVHVDTSTGSNFNRYWYANNNPYKYVDPDGESPINAAGAVIGGVAGALGGGVMKWQMGGSWREITAATLGGAVTGAITGGTLGASSGLVISVGAAGAAGSLGEATTQTASNVLNHGTDVGNYEFDGVKVAASGAANAITGPISVAGAMGKAAGGIGTIDQAIISELPAVPFRIVVELELEERVIDEIEVR